MDAGTSTTEEQLAALMQKMSALARSKEGGELALALIEVVRTVNGWKDELILNPRQAADEVLTAIETGLRGL